MKRVGRGASILGGLALMLVLGGCTLLMLPAMAIDDAKNAGRQREVRAVLLELSIGKPPPGGLDAWLARHKDMADLKADGYGQPYIEFPRSLCGAEAKLQDGRVTAITARCVKTSCSYGHLQTVDCSWMAPLLTHE
jgi:hypothetical protein